MVFVLWLGLFTENLLKNNMKVIDVSSNQSEWFRLVAIEDIEEIETSCKQKLVMIFANYDDLTINNLN